MLNIRIDLNCLCRRSHSHLEVQRFALIHFEMNIRQVLAGKPLFVDGDIVDTWRQFGYRVVSVSVGDRTSLYTGRLVGQLYMGSWYDRPSRVCNRTGDQARRCLGMSPAGKYQHNDSDL